MVEAYLLRILLIRQVQYEKHSKIVDVLKSKLIMTREVLTQHQETIRTLVHYLKVLLRMMAIEVWTHVASDTRLKGLLNEALSYLMRLKEEIFTLKNN